MTKKKICDVRPGDVIKESGRLAVVIRMEKETRSIYGHLVAHVLMITDLYIGPVPEILETVNSIWTYECHAIVEVLNI